MANSSTFLYPLLFTPSFHYRIWGGNKLKKYNKNITQENIGESWEISSIPNYVSVVSNGSLKDKNLHELIDIYKEKLVGTQVFEKYGEAFPLLIKFLTSEEPLSVQVHPNDDYARQFNSFGKTEMWYILEAEENSELIIGFNKGITKDSFINNIRENTVESVLRKIHPKKGDVFYLPAGRIHAIGKGITLVEVQQASDITYRVFDYNRTDKDDKTRKLHIPQALEVADFSYVENVKSNYDQTAVNSEIINSPYFKVSLWSLSENKVIHNNGDSFQILICVEGRAVIEYEGELIRLMPGQTVLFPACLENVIVKPESLTRLLEVHID